MGKQALLAVLLSGCGCGDEDTLRVTTATLPDGIVGAEYETRLEADGPGDHFWGFTSGRLPPGLTLSQSGLLSGTPSAEGDFAFGVRGGDAAVGQRAGGRAAVERAVGVLHA